MLLSTNLTWTLTWMWTGNFSSITEKKYHILQEIHTTVWLLITSIWRKSIPFTKLWRWGVWSASHNSHITCHNENRVYCSYFAFYHVHIDSIEIKDNHTIITIICVFYSCPDTDDTHFVARWLPYSLKKLPPRLCT